MSELGEVIGPYDKYDWQTMLLYKAQLQRMKTNPVKYRYLLETEEKKYKNNYLQRRLAS